MRILMRSVALILCVAAPAVQAGNLTIAPGNRTGVNTPLSGEYPNLGFNQLTVDHVDHGLGHMFGASIVVRYFSVPLENGAKPTAESTCNRPHPFSVQLQVRNLGHADYVPSGPGESVTLQIGSWNAAMPLTALPAGKVQTYNFMPSLGGGNYVLKAHINTSAASQVAGAPLIHDVEWPLKVICDTKSAAPPRLNVGFRPGRVIGMIWWDKTVLPRNLTALNAGPNHALNGCAGLTVMLGRPTAFGPNLGNLQYLRYAERGNIAQCQFEFSQVPVDTDLAVGYTVAPGMFRVPIVSPAQSSSFKVPGRGNPSYSLRIPLRPNAQPQLMSP